MDENRRKLLSKLGINNESIKFCEKDIVKLEEKMIEDTDDNISYNKLFEKRELLVFLKKTKKQLEDELGMK